MDRVEHGRYLASNIPNARPPSSCPSFLDDLIWTGTDDDPALPRCRSSSPALRPAPRPDRVLATVLFTATSSARLSGAASVGDRVWREPLDAQDRLTREEIVASSGREVKTTVMASWRTFDGPARAVRSALAISSRMHEVGLEVRAGVHTGEIELIGADIGGLLSISRRASRPLQRPAKCSFRTRSPTSSSAPDWCSPRGRHALKGVPGEWTVYAATR